LILGFVDKVVNDMLCLDEGKEASVVLAPIGIGCSQEKPKKMAYPSRFVPDIVPLSKNKEMEYPQIWELHNASSLNSSEEVRKWTDSVPMIQLSGTRKAGIMESKQIEPRPAISQSLSNVILLRGSTRKFSRQPIAFEQLSNILYSLTRRINSDFIDKKSMIDIYFIANEVANLQSGAYFFNRKDNSINLLNSKRSQKYIRISMSRTTSV
jgi:hypothetical protein